MIGFIASAAIVLLLGIWVARGFLGSNNRSDRAIGNSMSRMENKFGIYRSILDLEEDFRLGKVSNQDHDELRSRYEAEVLQILREGNQNQASTTDGITEQLEREIAEARQALVKRRESE